MTAATELRIDRSLLEDTIYGLREFPKELNPRWLYDDTGSHLFEMICELPEYYLTRAELEIMSRYADEIAQFIGADAAIVELGSGSSKKTRLLLDKLESPATYIPVDIARSHLLDAAGSIARDYPTLNVAPLCADFTKPLVLPLPAVVGNRKAIYFPGSTIGNFKSFAAHHLLRSMASMAGRDGMILIGVDLRKDVAVMERAYNDSTGITARFNLNALRHVNRRLGADFPLDSFEHRAQWVEGSSRIEMRLVCKRRMTVRVGSESLDFAKGEFIVTEYCHKYTDESFAYLAAMAGLQVRGSWVDAKNRFSVQLLQPTEATARSSVNWVSGELAAFEASLHCLSDSGLTDPCTNDLRRLFR